MKKKGKNNNLYKNNKTNGLGMSISKKNVRNKDTVSKLNKFRIHEKVDKCWELRSKEVYRLKFLLFNLN